MLTLDAAAHGRVVSSSRRRVPTSQPPMSLFLDIGTGAGLAGATGVRPFLPPLLAGALARGDMGIDFDGTDWSFLESPGFLLAVLALARGRRTWPNARAANRARGDRASSDPSGVIGVVLGALLFAGALADGGEPSWIGLVRGPLCAALGWLAVGGLLERPRAGSTPSAAALLTVYADGAALVLAALAIFVPPLAFLALVGFVVLLLGGGRREGEKYAGLRICASRYVAARKKLVLAVIDSLKPDMLDQAIEEGRAPALAALLRARHLRARLRVHVPVGHARWRRRRSPPAAGPGEHHIPSMNWFHRGEERYVEYGSSLPATRAFGVVRSLYDTVYNMNLAHLSRAHKTVFEHLDDAGLRTACTTYLIYRGRTRHDPSGASVYRRIAEAAPVPPPGLRRARALLRRPVRLARHGLHVGARHARPARPPHRLRGRVPGRARPLRLPALLAARQRHLLAQGRSRRPGALDRRGRPRARADHARGRRGRGLPRGARRDRDVGPLADGGRGAASTSPRRFADWRVLAPGRPGARRGRARRLPGGPLGDGLRARRGAPRGARAAAGGRARRAWRGGPGDHGARTARRVVRSSARASCASRPGGELADARGGRWSVERRARRRSS